MLCVSRKAAVVVVEVVEVVVAVVVLVAVAVVVVATRRRRGVMESPQQQEVLLATSHGPLGEVRRGRAKSESNCCSKYFCQLYNKIMRRASFLANLLNKYYFGTNEIRYKGTRNREGGEPW